MDERGFLNFTKTTLKTQKPKPKFEFQTRNSMPTFNVNQRNHEKMNVTVFDSDVVFMIGVNRNTDIPHLNPISFLGS